MEHVQVPINPIPKIFAEIIMASGFISPNICIVNRIHAITSIMTKIMFNRYNLLIKSSPLQFVYPSKTGYDKILVISLFIDEHKNQDSEHFKNKINIVYITKYISAISKKSIYLVDTERLKSVI